MKAAAPYLCWRNGRPRWVPSPELRARGCRGQDLKNRDGTWMNLSDAITEAKALNERARYAPRPSSTAKHRKAAVAAGKRRARLPYSGSLDLTERVGRHLIRSAEDFLDLLMRHNALRKRRRLPTSGAYIYIFELDGRWAKIGYTTNPAKRHAHHLVHVPLPLVPRLLTPGGVGDEKRLHRIFAEFHAQGEWYRVEGRFKEWLQALAAWEEKPPI